MSLSVIVKVTSKWAKPVHRASQNTTKNHVKTPSAVSFFSLIRGVNFRGVNLDLCNSACATLPQARSVSNGLLASLVTIKLPTSPPIVFWRSFSSLEKHAITMISLAF